MTTPATRPPGRPVTRPCGTVAAYRRHQRHGEPPCDACRQAMAAQQHDWYQRRRTPDAQEPPTT